jgi:hypothetical protein
MKFGTGNLYPFLWTSVNFMKVGAVESRTGVKGLNEILSLFSALFELDNI